ncbi:transcription initiation factor TFIIB [Pelomyxa schiedti]|nr:transcription initiation factor TFIIB [Pelomyxa schiedti]
MNNRISDNGQLGGMYDANANGIHVGLWQINSTPPEWPFSYEFVPPPPLFPYDEGSTSGSALQEPMCYSPRRRGQPCEYEMDERHGTVVCIYCGSVAQENAVDWGKEWRDFEGEASKSRLTIEDPLLPELGTHVGVVHTAGNTVKTGPSESPTTMKTRAALNKLGAFCDALNVLQRTQTAAKELFVQYSSKSTGVTNATDPFLCAILYTACKRERTPRTLKDIAEGICVPQDKIRKAYSQLCKVIPEHSENLRAHDLVESLCHALGLEYVIIKKAQATVLEISSKLEGRKPTTIAATAVLVACKSPPVNYTGYGNLHILHHKWCTLTLLKTQCDSSPLLP